MQSTTLNKKPLIGPRHWNFLSVRVNTFEWMSSIRIFRPPRSLNTLCV
jgi:hypothetical protein